MTDLTAYQSLSKNALKLMRITSAIKMMILVVIPAGVFAVYAGLYFSSSVGLIFFSAALLPALLCFIIVPKIRWKRYKYLLSDDRIEVVEGILFTRRTIVPIDRIYQIDVKRGPLDNLTGVAKVAVTTAGSFASFRFLDLEIADGIAMHLNERVLKKINAKGAEKDV
ncbi:MAG: PH domain-containing protein [Oscillospiraceae bacterium]|nr:PH domain-containing protein [Oscillospiraceae bacterium]